jgi:hypothetical protein
VSVVLGLTPLGRRGRLRSLKPRRRLRRAVRWHERVGPH